MNLKLLSKATLLLFFIATSLTAKIDIPENEISQLSREEILLVLESNSYYPTKSNNSGDTIIHMAIKKGDMIALKLSVAYGVDPKMPNKAQDTPLHLAAEKGNLEAVKYLTELGVSIQWPNKLGQTPYHKALQNDHVEILTFLKNCGYVPGKEADDLLISLGYNPTIKDSSGNTVLHRAALANDLEILLILIEQGWNINSGNKTGKTALILAASKGHIETMQLLLEHGADINLGDEQGNTPLVIAMRKQQDLTLNYILDNTKVAVNNVNKKGITALHYAVSDGNLYATQLLLQKGALVNLETKPIYWEEPYIPEDFGDFDFPGRDVPGRGRAKGFLAPKVSPLAIAKLRHPQNKTLEDLLLSNGATYLHVAPVVTNKVSTSTLEAYLK